MLFSHVKISTLLRLHKKLHHSHLIQNLKGLVFIGVYIIYRILHGRLEIRNFSSCVKKYFTRSQHSLVKYCSTLEEKFRISVQPSSILYLISLHKHQWNSKPILLSLRKTHFIITCNIYHSSGDIFMCELQDNMLPSHVIRYNFFACKLPGISQVFLQ